MALTADRNTPYRDGDSIVLGVATLKKIYAGSLVALDANGYATPGATATTLKGLGRAEEQVDNSSGLDGALTVEIRRGIFRWANSSAADEIADDDIGKRCYIVDDQTVALTNGTNTRSVAGIIFDVDDDGVWVDMQSDEIPAEIGTADIADGSVTHAKYQDVAANTIICRDANSAGSVSAKALTDTQILICDGTGFTAAALSGDATMTNGGVVSVDETLIQYATVALTNSNIKNMRGTEITLVAAPGATKVIEFISAILFLNYGSEVLTESGDNMAIRYTDGSGAIVSETIEATGFIDQAADTITNAIAKADAIVAAASALDQALVIHNTGDGEYGGNASNDTTMTIKVAYRVHDLS